jgi:HK97 gp10 family phage protein
MGATLKGDLTTRMRKGERKASTAVRQTAKGIVKGAQARVPVDTGHLRSSIKAEDLDDHQALVTVDTRDERHPSYAAFQEYGTRHHAAQPFLIPAVEAEREPFLRRIRKAYEQ